MKTKLILILALVLSCVALDAGVKVPSIFGDNMVLQLGRPVPVWGVAEPGENITVAFAGQTKTATAGADGKWRVNLDPLTASKEPRELTITGASTLRFKNVLVGVVWLCSGQSNMEWTLQKSQNGDQEIAASTQPLLRLFHVKKTWSDTPRDDVTLENTWAWAAASPGTTPKFSAVGYYFGRALLKAFGENVPVGLINSSWGGTRIEPWTSPAGFDGIPALADIDNRIQSATPGSDINKRLTARALADYEAWLAAARADAASGKLVAPPPDFPAALLPLSADNTSRPQQNPTVLYNAMIAPLAPFAIQGAIWYQGEANRADGALYYDKLNALAASWRREFENPALPLHIVQLAPYKYGGDTTSLPEIWAAQSRFARDDKYSGIAIINDVGNINDIHPTNKLTVGTRLACLALNKTYGIDKVKCDSPEPADIRFTEDSAIITFANTAKLATRDGAAPDWFELGGPGGWRKASATIKDNTVTVRAAGVTQPAAVRYAWSGTAEPNLRDAETGFQVGAFTHGEIPPPPELARLGADAAGFQVLYDLDPLDSADNEVSYSVNNAAAFAGKKIKRVAYYLRLANQDGDTWAFVSLDAFSQDAKKLGVPTKNSGARFQQNVANLVVRSNVPGVKTGAFKQGNIEFWDCNYSATNAAKVPGASDQAYDFGDSMNTALSPGYGSMQIHNTAEKQVVIAYNNWRKGKACDIGIGNQPGGGKNNPDWTFSKSGGKLQAARLLVLVQAE